MSKPKYYWNGMVKKMIMRYPRLNDEKTSQAGIFIKSIEKSLEETRKLPNGELRVQAIEDIYFTKIKTLQGVALDFNYSERTVQNWLNSFVNLVGKNAGF